MDKELTDIRTMKSGTDYIVMKIPKRLLKRMPEGYFYVDIIIKAIRGGKKK